MGNRQGKLLKLDKRIVFILKLLFFSGLIIFLLNIFALAEGIGYTKSFRLVRVDYGSQDHSTVAYCRISLNMSFNPLFFLLTYQIDQGQVSGPFDVSYVLPPHSVVVTANFRDLIEYVTVNALVYHELVRNLPYTFVLGSILGFVTTKIIERLED